MERSFEQFQFVFVCHSVYICLLQLGQEMWQLAEVCEEFQSENKCLSSREHPWDS